MTNGLETLYGDWCALRQQSEDVETRYEAKRSELQEAIAALTKQWEEANAELVKERGEINTKLDETDKELRAAVIAAYETDPSKKTVAPGLSVRVTEKMVYSEDAALEWAKDHGLALALDRKAFEKIAKATPLAFVEVEQKPTAVIAAR